MTESTSMYKLGRQLEQQESQKIPEGRILESIAEKMTVEIERFSLAGGMAVMFSETIKTAGKAIPFAYKPAKKFQELAARDLLQPYGYEYKPDEIIYTAFRILEAKKAFTPEEEEFVRNNYIAIKRLILERYKLKEEKGEQKGKERMEEIYEAAKTLVRATLKRGEKPQIEKQRKTVAPDAANEFDLLGINIFDLAELGGTDPIRLQEILAGKCYSYSTPGMRAEHYRRIFGTDRDISDEVIEKTFRDKQGKFLKRINRIWEQILKMFHEKEENVKKAKFSGRVKDCESIFELYEMLNEIGNYSSLTEEKVEEIDQARVKLLLYLRAAKVRLSPQHRLRHSVKAYTDDYLAKNIFEITGKEKIPVPVGSPIDISKAEKLETEVLTARLIDPDGEEPISVYLYQGGDSEHPKVPKSGIVNLKSMAKMVLKSLTEKKEPNDLFRITVMPTTGRKEDLERVREILAKTILHPQSLDISSAIEEENKTSAYGRRDVKRETAIIVPSIMRRGTLKRGYIGDVRNGGKAVPLSSFKLEVRTGYVHDIVSEHHPFDDTNHGVYRRIRTLPTFNLLRDPRHYLGNWMGRAVQIFDSMSEKLERTTTDTLPLWVRLKCMQAYFSVLEHGRRNQTFDI